MRTKLDIENEKRALRIKRKKNIEALKAKLQRAYDVKAVLPAGSGVVYNTELRAEHEICNKMIDELEVMIESENIALLALDEEVVVEDSESKAFQGIEF